MRFAIVAFAVLIASSSSCSNPVASAQLVGELAERAGGAVWAVESEGCGWRMNGSAFAIDARHLVTNRHVVANDSSPSLESKDGKKRSGRVIGSSEHPDVAIIEVADDLPQALPWADTKSLAKREPLVAIGYPAPSNAFTASAGQIVNFQGPNGTREAALANTPIEHGNSGGPGVRADASVAGVVTLMKLHDDPAQRVAILFTADAVRPTIEDFIKRPQKVLSTCGLGPDYIPPVPKTYDIPEAPPTAAPVAALPQLVSTPKPGAQNPLPTPTGDPLANYPQWSEPPRAPCPTGTAFAQIDEVTATEKPEEPGWWAVNVRGSVHNRSTEDVWIRRIDVAIEADPVVEGTATPDRTTVEPDGTAPWSFGEVNAYSPERQPSAETTTVKLTWTWTGNSVTCPTGSPTPT